VDLRSLGLLRIGLALLLLADLAGRATDLTAHYTDEGVMPIAAITEPASSFHLLNGSIWFEGALFLVAGLFAVLLLLGYYTRLATFASWALVASLQARNPVVLDSGDTLLRMMLFWGLFLPLGARYSIDGRQSPLARGQGNTFASVASAGLLLQICFVYWFGAALKTDPMWWHQGTAVGYVLSLESWATPLGRSLLAYPGLVKALTIGTLALEVLGPALAFSPVFTGPLRTAVVLAFILFHTALGLCIKLGLFPFVCIVAWLAFLPPWFWDKFPGVRRSSAESATEPEAGAEDLRPSPAANAVAACCLLYVFLWNVRSLDEAEFDKFAPPGFKTIGQAFGLNQSWAMFGANIQTNGLLVVEGTLIDSRRVNLVDEGQGVDWEAIPPESATYKNQRWRKFAWTLPDDRFAKYRRFYAEYLCGAWNARHPEGEQVRSVAMYFVARATRPDFQFEEPRKISIYEEVFAADPSRR
jgi:hypothetical protein